MRAVLMTPVYEENNDPCQSWKTTRTMHNIKLPGALCLRAVRKEENECKRPLRSSYKKLRQVPTQKLLHFFQFA